MAFSRDSSYIQRPGSINATVVSSTASVTLSGSAEPFPILATSGFTKTPSKTTVNDESGNTYELTTSTETRLTGEILQNDLSTLSELQTRTGYIAMVKQVHDKLAGDAAVNFVLFPKIKLDGAVSQSAGSNISFDWLAEAVTADVGIDVSQFADASFDATLTGTITVSAGEAFALFSI